MKYGDTLRQRSIPEWSHYNIDYDYLKDLIKHHTTPGAGTALSIPGQGGPTERAFGETFLAVMCAQHDRINLFVKSKSGEIERRLDYIGRQLAQLQARQAPTSSTLLPARAVERYAKIDQDLARVGEEIQSLSRFRIAQQTGFYKILKKYKRWTRDRDFERRFKAEVTSSPDSFFQLNLGYLLDQYIDVLGALRAALEHPGASGSPADPDQPSSASRLSKAVDEGSELDFDVALTATRMGPHGTRATYWIHPDNIVQIEVMLLHHMRLHVKPNAVAASPEKCPQATSPQATSPQATSPQATSPQATPPQATPPLPSKLSGRLDNGFGVEDHVGLVVIDQPAAFARKQNARKTSSADDNMDTVPSNAAGIARWTSTGEAAVVVGLDGDPQSGHPDSIKVAKLKRKRLEAFLNPSASSCAGDNSGHTDAPKSAQENETDVEGWLAEHKEARPIASICSRRRRFVGLHNTLVGGIWAALDRDIRFSDAELSLETRDDSPSFPHAVLEVRREGTQSAGLIQALDRSHLVEKIFGFSLEAHAIWTCCKPSNMSQPTWVSILGHDIRKLPTPVKRQRRNPPSTNGSTAYFNSQASTSATASPNTSYSGETSASEMMDPFPLHAFRKKRKSTSRYPPPAQIKAPRTPGYWNEYDNPESEEEEGYYIYVDPNASIKLPGQELLEAWVRKTRDLLRLGKGEDAVAEDGSSDDETGDESLAGFLDSYGTMPTPNGVSRPHDGPRREGYFSSLFRSLRGGHRHRSMASMRRRSERERQSLLAEIHVRQHEREMAKFQLYASCLGAAAVLDTVLVILTTTSRRKLRGEVDKVVILGVICNMLLLLAAVTGMMSRRERLGWFHQGFVFLMVVGMVVADALLFWWTLSL